MPVYGGHLHLEMVECHGEGVDLAGRAHLLHVGAKIAQCHGSHRTRSRLELVDGRHGLGRAAGAVGLFHLLRNARSTGAEGLQKLAQELRVVPLGEDAAVVAYGATAKRGDTDVSSLFNSTYQRVDGTWKLAVHQQTPR